MTLFKRLFLSFAIISASSLFISPVLADENSEFSFEIANNLNIDANRSITPVSDITLIAKKSYEGSLAVKIPSTLKGIFSQDVSLVVLGGNAAAKLNDVTMDMLSADQKTLTLSLKEPLKALDTIIISGLQLKLYQEDNAGQPIALEYVLDGATFLLNSANTIRLDTDGIRRRYNSPEAVRNVTFTPVNTSDLEIRWNQSPDLDSIGYELTVKNASASTPVLDRFFLEKTKPFHTVQNLNPNLEYTVTISALNNAGLKTDTTQTYQLPKADIVTDVSNYIHLRRNSVEFAALYEELVPAEYQQFPFDGTKNLTTGDLFTLLKKTTVFSSAADRTRFYVLRFERIRERFITQDLSNLDFIRLLSQLSAREHIRNTEALFLPDLSEKTILERRHLMQVYKLQRKGVITEAALVTDPSAKVPMETFYSILLNLLKRMQAVEESA